MKFYRGLVTLIIISLSFSCLTLKNQFLKETYAKKVKITFYPKEFGLYYDNFFEIIFTSEKIDLKPIKLKYNEYQSRTIKLDFDDYIEYEGLKYYKIPDLETDQVYLQKKEFIKTFERISLYPVLDEEKLEAERLKSEEDAKRLVIEKIKAEEEAKRLAEEVRRNYEKSKEGKIEFIIYDIPTGYGSDITDKLDDYSSNKTIIRSDKGLRGYFIQNYPIDDNYLSNNFFPIMLEDGRQLYYKTIYVDEITENTSLHSETLIQSGLFKELKASINKPIVNGSDLIIESYEIRYGSPYLKLSNDTEISQKDLKILNEVVEISNNEINIESLLSCNIKKDDFDNRYFIEYDGLGFDTYIKLYKAIYRYDF